MSNAKLTHDGGKDVVVENLQKKSTKRGKCSKRGTRTKRR